MCYYLGNMMWLVAFLVSTVPSFVFAQDPEGLVTCSGPDCDMCDFVGMINGLVDWLFGFLVLAAVLGLMISGFKLVISAGNESAWTAAKSMVTSIIIGFVIVLSAWLIVDTIMKAFLAPESGFGMWNEIPAGQWGGIAIPGTETEDEARDRVRESHQNVIDTYVGQMGVSAHLQFVQECVANDGIAVLRSGTTDTVDCRTR